MFVNKSEYVDSATANDMYHNKMVISLFHTHIDLVRP